MTLEVVPSRYDGKGSGIEALESPPDLIPKFHAELLVTWRIQRQYYCRGAFLFGLRETGFLLSRRLAGGD